MNLTQGERIHRILKTNPNREYTCRQLANIITTVFSEEYDTPEKRFNPRFNDDEKLMISQVRAETSANKYQLLKNHKHIHMTEDPIEFWYDKSKVNSYQS